MANTNSVAHVRVIEETPAFWRVVFDYPPFNIVDAIIFEALQGLLARMDASPSLRVIVFESANPEFYLAHFDLTGKIGNIMTAVGASGLPILMDTFVRLTKSPVASIAKIRGCVRGVSSEFVLACDMRFASRENTRLGQPEVGVGLHPGGGGTERLPHLVGRDRCHFLRQLVEGWQFVAGVGVVLSGLAGKVDPSGALAGVSIIAPNR